MTEWPAGVLKAAASGQDERRTILRRAAVGDRKRDADHREPLKGHGKLPLRPRRRCDTLLASSFSLEAVAFEMQGPRILGHGPDDLLRRPGLFVPAEFRPI